MQVKIRYISQRRTSRDTTFEAREILPPSRSTTNSSLRTSASRAAAGERAKRGPRFHRDVLRRSPRGSDR